MIRFGEEIPAQNFDMYNINKAIIQTQRPLFSPSVNKQDVIGGKHCLELEKGGNI